MYDQQPQPGGGYVEPGFEGIPQPQALEISVPPLVVNGYDCPPVNPEAIRPAYVVAVPQWQITKAITLGILLASSIIAAVAGLLFVIIMVATH